MFIDRSREMKAVSPSTSTHSHFSLSSGWTLRLLVIREKMQVSGIFALPLRLRSRACGHRLYGDSFYTSVAVTLTGSVCLSFSFHVSLLNMRKCLSATQTAESQVHKGLTMSTSICLKWPLAHHYQLCQTAAGDETLASSWCCKRSLINFIVLPYM